MEEHAEEGGDREYQRLDMETLRDGEKSSSCPAFCTRRCIPLAMLNDGAIVTPLPREMVGMTSQNFVVEQKIRPSSWETLPLVSASPMSHA